MSKKSKPASSSAVDFAFGIQIPKILVINKTKIKNDDNYVPR